ncbi:hypothetical protein VTK26DRAFT_2123 [Humicola hyalothermophila]
MTPTPRAGTQGPDQKFIPNQPGDKLPPIPKGSRIQKRPLPGPSPAAKPRHASSTDPRTAAADLDGYLAPARAPGTVVIKVASSATFMSLVKRVRKALEKAGPQRWNGRGGGQQQQQQPATTLAARVAALKNDIRANNNKPGVVEDALDDVVLVATGRAIQKAVEVGGFFTRERELVVLVRTRTLRAIDDIVVGGGDQHEDGDAGGEEDQVRVRNLSCVEVGIRWAS